MKRFLEGTGFMIIIILGVLTMIFVAVLVGALPIIAAAVILKGCGVL